MEKIAKINAVVKSYFEKEGSVAQIPAKDLMPQFIEAGIFVQDQKNGLPIRKMLRALDEENKLHLIPFVFADRKSKNTNWFFQRNDESSYPVPPKPKVSPEEIKTNPEKTKLATRRNSDENYVLDLCDEVLGVKGERQHKFSFLVGDSGKKLPVDIFYEELNLVIEFREYQHSNPVKHFDKPGKMTVSGVHRGEQRKIYDQRRREVLPAHGIMVVEIDYSDFEHNKRSRIIRNHEQDLKLLKLKLIQRNK